MESFVANSHHAKRGILSHAPFDFHTIASHPGLTQESAGMTGRGLKDLQGDGRETLAIRAC